MADDEPTPSADRPATLHDRLAGDLGTLETELAEIELLVTQATAEAARHEGRRAAAVTKLDALAPDGDPTSRLELTTNLVTLTRRAALMESQVDVLEGKRRTLARYRDAVAAYRDAAAGLPAGAGAGGAIDALDPDAPMPAAVSRRTTTVAAGIASGSHSGAPREPGLAVAEGSIGSTLPVPGAASRGERRSPRGV
jgi:hypothetical protein